MKTKKFRIVLPAFVFLLAAGFAFSMENTIEQRVAHYYNPNQGWESIMVDDSCFDGGVIPCEFAGLQLYSEPDFGSTALHKN